MRCNVEVVVVSSLYWSVYNIYNLMPQTSRILTSGHCLDTLGLAHQQPWLLKNLMSSILRNPRNPRNRGTSCPVVRNSWDVAIHFKRVAFFRPEEEIGVVGSM